MASSDLWYTACEVGQIFDFDESTVRSWARDRQGVLGKLAMKVGGRWRWPRQAVDDMAARIVWPRSGKTGETGETGEPR